MGDGVAAQTAGVVEVEVLEGLAGWEPGGSDPSLTAVVLSGGDFSPAACVVTLQGDARPVQGEGTADALAVLDERRVALAQSRVRAVNQLHALLRALLAGGAPTDLSATKAAALLRTVRPAGSALSGWCR